MTEKMNSHQEYRNPKILIQKLGIEKPEDIDIEAIACHCNAEIVYEPLYGCDARIIGNNNNKKAIISINNQGVSIPRQRFSAAHELGHWILDKGKNVFACTEDIFLKEWSQNNPERLANQYAADLLLPDSIFNPIAQNQKIIFENVKKIAEKFKTSITATAIRIVELGSLRAMLICTELKKRCWFIRGPRIPKILWPVDEVKSNSIANKIFQGNFCNSPSDVRADNWITHENSYKYYLYEDSIRVSNNCVLTLLWWKDEQQLLDLDDEEDFIDDSVELKW